MYADRLELCHAQAVSKMAFCNISKLYNLIEIKININILS